MGWSNIDEKHKKKFDRYYVSCNEPYEKAYIAYLVKDEFPWLEEDTINEAIISCCVAIPAPRQRWKFFERMQRMLKVG